jgi:hypothetical protein
MQLFGLGLAGLAYKYIVEPPQMASMNIPSRDTFANKAQIWPSTLANAALFQTLHSGVNVEADGWKITRYRFFLYVFLGSFVWYWFPGFIFTALSTFAFVCWAAPSE